MTDQLIYLDNAATTIKKPSAVAPAMVQALSTCGNPGRGAHETALQAARVVYQAREQMGHLLGVYDPRRVAFFFNATDALNAAITGMIKPGMRVVTTAAEHNAVLRPLYRTRDEQGISLTIVDVNPTGEVCLQRLLTAITRQTDVVVVSHASNVTGAVLDIAAVAQRVHEVGARIIVDAAQTAGALPIRCDDWQIDALAFTGHKALLGPQGTGGLCLQPNVVCRPWRCGGDGTHSASPAQPPQMPDCLEAGTHNVCGLAGLSAALTYLLNRGIDDIQAHEAALSTRLLAGLIPLQEYGLVLHGVPTQMGGVPRAPVCSFTVEGMDSALVSDLLMQHHRICTRAGLHCAPLMHQALGTHTTGTVRISCSAFTTLDEVDALLCALSQIVVERS